MFRLQIFFIFLLFFGFDNFVSAQIISDEIQIPNRKNAQENLDKPYIILISADGFRPDYYEKFDTSFLKSKKAEGVSGVMLPSFPSVTFPNHYTLVTGMIPAHHGLIGNNMYDPKTGMFYSLRNQEAVRNSNWYGGIPIWSLAESQQLLTACFYWPGSEAEIAGYHPTYYFPYAETKKIEDRIEKMKSWLSLPKEKRPHFLTFYLPQVDQAGHKFGPEALETAYAAKFVDVALQKLTEELDALGLDLTYIFVSDHGMTSVDLENPILVPNFESEQVKLVRNGTYLNIFVEEQPLRDKIFQELKSRETSAYATYLKEEIPEKYKFSSQNDLHHRIGDIVMIAEAPYYFTSNPNFIPRGAHGYLAEETPDMKTVFLAWGKNIQQNKQIEEFENVHLYALLVHLLGLEYEHDIDGDDRLIEKVVEKK